MANSGRESELETALGIRATEAGTTRNSCARSLFDDDEFLGKLCIWGPGNQARANCYKMGTASIFACRRKKSIDLYISWHVC